MSNPWVWVAGILAVCVIAGLALWRGKAAEIGMGLKGLTVRIPRPDPPDEVVVAEDLNVGGKVGAITGRKIETGATPGGGPRSTVVASGMVVAPGGSVDSITGESVTGTAAAAKKKGK